MSNDLSSLQGEPSKLGCVIAAAAAIAGLFFLLRPDAVETPDRTALTAFCPADTHLFVRIADPGATPLFHELALPGPTSMKDTFLLDGCQTWGYARFAVGKEGGGTSEEHAILLNYRDKTTASARMEQYKKAFGGPLIGASDTNGYHSWQAGTVLVLTTASQFQAYTRKPLSESPRLSSALASAPTDLSDGNWLFARPDAFPTPLKALILGYKLPSDSPILATATTLNDRLVIQVHPLTAPPAPPAGSWWRWVLYVVLAPFALIAGLLALLVAYILGMAGFLYLRQWREGKRSSRLPPETELSPALKEDLEDNPLNFTYRPAEKEPDSDSRSDPQGD